MHHDSDMMIVIIMTTMFLLTVGLVSGNGGGVCGIVVDGGRIGAMGRSADGKDDSVHTHSPTPTHSWKYFICAELWRFWLRCDTDGFQTAPNRAGTTMSARVHRRKQNAQSLRVLEVLGRVICCVLYCLALAI